MSEQTSWRRVYARDLVPAIFSPWSIKTVGLVTPQPGEYVLDVACGTGVVTRLAAQYTGASGRVVGLDVDSVMIEVARSLPLPPGLSIELREGDAHLLPFSRAAFHIVFCQGGLQFFTDRLTALREMHRVLRPGGRLALMVCQDIQYCPGFAVLADKVSQRIGSRAAYLLRVPFMLGDAEALRSLLIQAGFQDVVIRPDVTMISFPTPGEFVRAVITGSPLAEQVDSNTLAKLVNEGGIALQAFVNDGKLSFPMGAHLITARA